MRTAEKLERQQLLEIVENIQGFLYLDLDDRGAEVWNRDKPCTEQELYQRVVGLLDDHGLAPDKQPPAKALRFVLYDIDADRLVSNIAYACFPQAAEDAAGLDDVVILRLDVPARLGCSPAGEPVTVRLQSDEFGVEDFHYDDLDEALQAVRRLYGECLKQDDHTQRQISVLVGRDEDADDGDD